MKKIMTLLFSIGLLLGLTSCGGGAPDIFTVSFETEHGTAPEPISVEDGTILTAEQLKALTCEGYTFLGWFDGETEAKADEYTVTKDVTLTAKWEIVPPPAPTKYTVTFKSEYGKAPETITVEENTVLTADQLKPLSATGYVFKGWFDGTEEAKAGEYKVTKDVMLNAKWNNVASEIIGMWDYEYTENFTSYPMRIVFNEDKTCNATVTLNLLTFEVVLFYYYEGTYVFNNNKLTVTFDNTKFSLTQGDVWHPANSDELLKGMLQGLDVTTLEMIDIIKDVDISITDDKLICTNSTGSIELNKGINVDERLCHAWEKQDEDSTERFLFNSDNTFVYAMEKDSEVMYLRGKYLVLKQFYHCVGLEQSDDYENWEDLPKDMKLEVAAGFGNIISVDLQNKTLHTLGNRFNQMERTDIKF